MNEPVTKSRPQIDVEEFERYLRETNKTPLSPEGDPLAELARLVSNNRDPYDEVFSRGGDVNFGHAAPGERRQAVDFAKIEAGLRGSLPGHELEQPTRNAHYQQQAYPGGDQYYDPRGAGLVEEQQNWQEAPRAAPYQQARRSRRPVYAMVAVILAGVTGIGFAFAYKGKNSGPREVAMIKAVPGPSKIQPPADDAADQASHDAALIDSTQAPTPTKTVSHEEQPVDVAQSVQDAPRDTAPNNAQAANNGIAPIYDFGMSRPGGGANTQVASVSAPASPDVMTSAVASGDGHGVASDIQPIRVKTRKYRPDGTPVESEHIPEAAIDAAAGTPAAAAPPPDADTAAASKPTAPKAGPAAKTTTRAASISRPAAAKPVAMAAARDPDAPTDLTPSTARASSRAARPAKPVRLADARAQDNEPSQTSTLREGAGGFAVQLAAPGTEAEARQASSHLEQKFASELGGRRLSTIKAVSNGRTVYRLRVGSLSREEATGLCEKLKSGGGSCFIAKN